MVINTICWLMTSMMLCLPLFSPGVKGELHVWLHVRQNSPNSSALPLGRVGWEQLWGEKGRQSCWWLSHCSGISGSLWKRRFAHSGGTAMSQEKIMETWVFPMDFPTRVEESLEEGRRRLAYRNTKSMTKLLSQSKTPPKGVRIS